jgi:transposase
MTTKTPLPDVEIIDLPRSGRRRRFTAQEKRRLLDETLAPGASVSSVARRYGVSPSLLFRWRRLMDEGALESLDAEQRVVPESDVKHLQAQVRELQRLLGKKTMEVEILKEAVELARPKKRLLLRSHLPDKDGGE